MTQWHAVKVTTTKMVLVEVEDGREDAEGFAEDYARSEMDADDAEWEDGPLTGERLESFRRHADEVYSL